VPPRQALESLFGALVDVEQAQLQVQDGLAGDAESEMPGLDDTGVDRSDGNLEDAFTGDGPERVEVAGHSGHAFVGGEVLSQRPGALGPVVMGRDARRVGMTVGHEPEEIAHLAFEPVRGGMRGGDGGKSRYARIDGRRQPQERVQRRQRPEVMQHKRLPGLAFVGGKQRQQPSAESLDDLIGERRQRSRVDVGDQLARSQLPQRALGQLERGVHAHARNARRHFVPHTTSVAAPINASSGPGR
jgi:hypothetical protein